MHTYAGMYAFVCIHTSTADTGACFRLADIYIYIYRCMYVCIRMYIHARILDSVPMNVLMIYMHTQVRVGFELESARQSDHRDASLLMR